MWGLFNNSNQVPITLSIFGVVLTFVQYFFLPFWIPRMPEIFVLGADFSVFAACRHWRRMIKWIKTWKSPCKFFISIFNSQTVQPFEYVHSRCILITDESHECRGASRRGGLGACYPRKFWNFDALKRSVLVFWDGDFFLKCSLNWVLFLCLFLFGIFTFAGYQFQL